MIDQVDRNHEQQIEQKGCAESRVLIPFFQHGASSKEGDSADCDGHRSQNVEVALCKELVQWLKVNCRASAE